MRFTLVLLIAWSLCAQSVRAQDQAGPEPQIAQLRAMMSDARFDEALAQARALLARDDLDAAQRNATLETLAIGQLATRDARGANVTLTQLYARDPDHRLLDRDASPAVQAAFDRARESHPPPIAVTMENASSEHLPERAAPVLRVTLSAGADAVNELRLSYRQGERRDFQRVLMEHAAGFASAEARIPLLDGDAAYSVDWYVEALAPSQSIIGRLGDPLEPLSISVPRAAARVAANALQVTESGRRRDEEGGSVLGQWWFWTVVGVVVLGGAASAYLLTRPAEQTPCGSLGCGSL